MIQSTLPAALLLALVAPAVTADDAGDGQVVQGRITIHERIIIRVPQMPVGRMPIAAPAPPAPPVRMVEKKGPKCIALASLAGASIPRSDSVDLVLTGGKTIRAKLGDDCPALDFYAGFYLKPTADGMICADRDLVRSRSGASCPIGAFKTMVPHR